MKKNKLPLSLVVVSTVLSASSWADDAYFGGRVGYSELSDGCVANVKCDDENASYGGYFGYHYTPYLSVEYGVDYIGKFEANFDGNGSGMSRSNIWALSLTPRFNFSLRDNLQVFLKAGGAFVYAEDNKGFSPTASIGTEFELTPNLSLRAEYQRYQDIPGSKANNIDVNNFNLGLTYLFSKEPSIAPEPEELESKHTTVEMVYPRTITTVQFELEKTQPKEPQSFDRTIEIMNLYPQARLEVLGYSDSTGSDEFNQKLTQQRAEFVANQIRSFGVDHSRIVVKGLGKNKPIADNNTRAGRIRNRRVEVVIPSFTYKQELTLQ